ncbi:YlmC/YmxH family sporulation protein [Bacilliculturomica massiliensis]|uniref:YlmC/YmxH family sporulation protein n=1 Tax=Bacilliculturomica massiliensis TaxID=1917867 RepID=UPI00103128DD|nr:YlmC/YmxH family sporulation protein [Bacilliculturomica massiliensis]
MRLSDLGYKEIVNLSNGCRYGQLADSELLFDPRQGKIKALLVPEFTGRFHFGGSEFLQLPWNCIKKIGEDIIIVDADI